MIKTISDSTIYHTNHGVFSIPMTKYCNEVERALIIAKYKQATPPTDYQLKALSFYINGLREIGTLRKKDLLYMFTYGSLHEPEVATIRAGSLWTLQQRNVLRNFTKINLVNPEKYYLTYTTETLSNIRSLANTKNGIAKNTASEDAYISTGFNASIDAIKYSLDDASFTWYFDGITNNITNGSTTTAGIVNNAAGDQTLRVNPWTGTNSHIAGINGAQGNFGNGVTTQAGFHIVQRTSSSALAWYKNDAAYGTRTDASSAIYNGEMIFMIRHEATTSTIHVGASYTATERTQEYQLWNDYKRKLNIL